MKIHPKEIDFLLHPELIPAFKNEAKQRGKQFEAALKEQFDRQNVTQ